MDNKFLVQKDMEFTLMQNNNNTANNLIELVF